MNEYLVFIGLPCGGRGGTPYDPSSIQVTADSAEEAVDTIKRIGGFWSTPLFVLPAFAPPQPPDRRGLMGVTVIAGLPTRKEAPDA